MEEEVESAYVDVRDPPQSADDGRARDGITGVQDEAKEQDTSDSLSRRRLPKRSSDGTEPGLHGQRHSEDEEEEDTTRQLDTHSNTNEVTRTRIAMRWFEDRRGSKERS